MNEAMIFNIQKFSVHDGPGIRTTVFFKGCPLKCMWCHNPESQNKNKEILYDRDKCTLCGNCAKICPSNALKIGNLKLIRDINLCNYCEKCCVYCINEAREIAGKEYTVDEVFNEIIKDKQFYEQSGGGVTFSGGEPLVYIDFLEELFIKLKNENISIAIDTCGAVNFESLEKASRYADLFLYDIKLMEDVKHKEFVGVSNKIILNNLVKLSQIHNNINLRLPIIEGVNANIEHINGVLDLIKNLNIKKINLLPYHDIAKHKYKKLDIIYKEEKMLKPSNEKMNCFKEIFEKHGYLVKIGG